MSSIRQRLLATVNWYHQSSLKHSFEKIIINFITQVVVTDRFHCMLETEGNGWKHPVSSLWDSFYSPTLANNGYFFTTNRMQSITAYSLFGGLDSKKLDLFFISPLLIFDQYPTAACSNPHVVKGLLTFLTRKVLTKRSTMLRKWLR